jgi:hypothetical protein
MAILEEETYNRFGYYPSELSQGSHKKILVECDECRKIREVEKRQYRTFCTSCAQKGERNKRYGKSSKIKSICKTCGNEFWVLPCGIKRGEGQYCSRACYRKIAFGENASNWRGGKVKCICIECKRIFEVAQNQIKNGGGKFCSRKCLAKWRSKNLRQENSTAWKDNEIKRKCAQCGDIFEIAPARLNQNRGKFCSKKCMIEYLRGENSPAWKGGISFEPYCHKFNEEFKQYIRTKFGNVCFLCDKTEKENGQKLSVHHVNYDKHCGCAKTEEEKKADDSSCQFVPLCVSCNSKVNGNRDKWEQYIKNKLRNKLNGWYI